MATHEHGDPMTPRAATTPISFEFFPPRSPEQEEILSDTWQRLVRFEPEYFSVTFGAGGSSLDATHRAVMNLSRRSGVQVAPHLSCLVDSEKRLRHFLDEYRAAGVDRLVLLRGDRPEARAVTGSFQYASDLVNFVRQNYGDQFTIEVGCYPEFHPESPSPASDLAYFRQKVEAGASGAITQYFYNADSYHRFVEDCRRSGIDIPIRPGIMPITNYRQLARFSSICGAEIPQWILRRLEAWGDDLESIRAFGLDVVTRLCEQLLRDGAPGLHFYTLNRAQASEQLLARIFPG
jgi:methylenetetrahydrofolate reductase (NADPH)